MSNVATQFKKGQSGNINGRPKEPWTMTGLYKEAGDEADETGVPMKLAVAKKLWRLASKGDVVAIKELGNRIDGMPKQSTDITSGGKELQPILVKFLNDANDRTKDNGNSE